MVSTASIRSLLGSRQDSEHGQVLVRFALCAGTLIYFLAHYRTPLAATASTVCLGLICLGLLVAATQFALILRRPAVSHARRISGMAYDYSAIAAAMILMDETFAFAYGFLLWITVGNGLRYGNRYLLAATAAGAVAFSTVLVSSAYWQSQGSLSAGLLIALVAVPLYQGGLLKRSSLATQRMRMASEAKSRFMANMSHELRTPLNAIVVSSELLLSERVHAEERPQIARTIHSTAQSMLSIVQEVLNLSEMGAGRIVIEPCKADLAGLLSELRLMFLPLAQRKGLALEFGPAPENAQWELDLPRVRQILVNIIGNAVKYTERGSITVTATVLRRGRAGSLRFVIDDTGVGMDQPTLDTIYSPFITGSAPAGASRDSSGLGMNIVKTLVDAMGGSIVIVSDPGRGTRVTLDIPASEVLSEAEMQDANKSIAELLDHHRGAVGPRRILVVDDQSSNSEMVARLLKAAGHITEAFDNVDRALDAFASRPPCLVLVDLQMPELNGFEFARHVRLLDGGFRPTPVVLMTGEASDHVLKQAAAEGLAGVLQKPLSAATALPLLERVLRDAPLPFAPDEPAQSDVDAQPGDNVVAFKRTPRG